MAEKFPSELRLGSLSNRWVLIASGRANRPYDWKEPRLTEARPDPFSPENVHPDDITDRIANVTGKGFTVKADWRVLAIKNAYPFVSAEGPKPRLTGSVIDGYGFHEIVIHSPDPDKNFEDFEPEQTQAVLEMYLKRYNRLAHRPHIQHVQIFTNRGPEAGASIVHPHTQIVALPMVPPYIEQLVKAAHHHGGGDGNVAEDELSREIHDTSRIIYENSKFLVYCPFAPHADYHIRIMPKQPGSHFPEITQDQMEHLARILNLAFRRLDRIAGIPPYNAFIRTAPVHAKEEDLKGFRWHVDIVPHTSIPGGLEISTGLDVVTVFPEDAAHALRQDS
jgi:UDPglucose--hexose-1-phosphate uridylyltransferase